MPDASDNPARRQSVVLAAQSAAESASARPTATSPSTAAAPRTERRTPPPGWRTTFSSLDNRDFLYLWLGMLVMMGGMQMQMIARGYLAYELTSSPFLLGVVNSGFAIPLLGLSLFGGAFADRLERKYIIQFGQGMSAALAIVIGVAIHLDIVRGITCGAHPSYKGRCSHS